MAAVIYKLAIDMEIVIINNTMQKRALLMSSSKTVSLHMIYLGANPLHYPIFLFSLMTELSLL